MKMIGFVDYYISEWHADNYPEWIKDVAQKLGEDFDVSYVWAELDVSPESGVTTDEWCKNYGATKCESIAELCEKADYVMILSPSNPEKHLAYAKEVFKYGKNTYVDKTFAPDFNTAEQIFEVAKEYGTKFFSSSALRFADEACYVKPMSDLRITGGGRSLEEYIIHQIEMAVKIQGVGASSVEVKTIGDTENIRISYPDFRFSTLEYNDANTFSVNGNAVKSKFFLNLIGDILKFFITGKVPFDTKQTLEVIKIREAILKSVKDGKKISL